MVTVIKHNVDSIHVDIIQMFEFCFLPGSQSFSIKQSWDIIYWL